jgi:hypothetical protein
MGMAAGFGGVATPSPGSPDGKPLLLFEGGQPRATIVAPDGASPNILETAGDLADPITSFSRKTRFETLGSKTRFVRDAARFTL